MAADEKDASALGGADADAKVNIFAAALVDIFGDRARDVAEQQIANATEEPSAKQWRRIAAHLG